MSDHVARSLLIDVALSQRDVAATALRGTATIVVDVIRATTTLSVLFDRGCSRVLVAPDIGSARNARARYPGALLAGEINGAMPRGFDVGNSPAEVVSQDVAGREIIFATTNGAPALRSCSSALVTIAGSLRNARAAAAVALAHAAQDRPSTAVPLPAHAASSDVDRRASEPAMDDSAPDILIVCAGRANKPAYDDTICAGYLCEQLVEQMETVGRSPRLGEGARIATAVLGGVSATGAIQDALARSDAGRAIAAIGLGADVVWCAETNASDSAPVVTDNDEDGLVVLEQWVMPV